MLDQSANLPKYCEQLSTPARRRMDVVYRCVHCACGGKLCLNRSMRLINFAFEAEQDARARGAFMLARVSRSLFDVVRQSREWDTEHTVVIDAHFHTIRDLADAEQTKGAPLMGQALEDSIAPVEAWVEWLEQVGKRLVREHKTTFPCFRRATKLDCPVPEAE